MRSSEFGTTRLRRRVAPRRGAAGWALLTALLAALLVGLAGMTAQVGARVEREREREDDLLRAGRTIALALAAYHASPLAPVQEYPRDLAELVDDRRGPRVLRHLRVVPIDPATGHRDWVLIREGGRIIGVHSAATRAPLRRVGFPAEYAATFERARSLADWRFVPVQAIRAVPPGAQPAASDSDSVLASPLASHSALTAVLPPLRPNREVPSS